MVKAASYTSDDARASYYETHAEEGSKAGRGTEPLANDSEGDEFHPSLS